MNTSIISIKDVRQQLEVLDGKLIELLAQRYKLVGEASAENKLPACKIRSLARFNELPAELAEKIYQSVVRNFVETQKSDSDEVYRNVKQSYY